jgi:superfamily II DNA or RNA helicase
MGGIIKSGVKPDWSSPIQIASTQSLNRDRLAQLQELHPDIGLAIIDEAHRAGSKSLESLIAGPFRNVPVLGLTATPERTDGKGLRESGFEAIVCGPPIAWAIKHGYLCPYRLYASANTMRLGRSDAETEKANNSEQLAGDVVLNWVTHANGLKTVVFAIGCEHAQAIAERFNEAGITAEWVSGQHSKLERESILQRFEAGEFLVLVNCQLLLEGYDLPAIECVHFCRPTTSIIVWLQGLGRGLRPAPGKDELVIIDHSGNWERLGLPDDPRSWSLDGWNTDAGSDRQRRRRNPDTGQVEEVEEVLIEATSETLIKVKFKNTEPWYHLYYQLKATQPELKPHPY